MTDIIECNKTLDFCVKSTVNGKTQILKISLPKHQPVLKSWKMLCKYMEIYLKNRKDNEPKGETAAGEGKERKGET